MVPLGVDAARFTPLPHPAGREAPAPPTLLFVGRLRYYKGLHTLLHALTQLADARLTVVGEGPMRRVWQDLAVRLGLSQRVAFLGDVPDDRLVDVYRQADLFVLPANARAEAFGTVLLEAMASGLPCVTTEVGTGTSWVVQDGVTGRVVLPEDPLVLAEVISSLLADPQRREAMGQAGRARVEAHFTLERMIRGVQAVYDDAQQAEGSRVPPTSDGPVSGSWTAN